MKILSILLTFGLFGTSFSLTDYESVITSTKDGTIGQKLNKDLANTVFQNGRTLLHVASHFGNKDLLIKLRSFMTNFNPNLLDGNGISPLCLAASREIEDVDVVEYLISAGAIVNQMCAEQDGISPVDTDMITVGKYTPFLLAVNSTFIKTASLLKRKNAIIEAKDGLDYTPLCYAAMSDHSDSHVIMQQLLEWGANVNQQCGKIEIYKKETPLFLAVRISNNEGLSLKKAEILIQKGADQKLPNSIGWLPIHGAAANGFKKVADFLLSSVNRATQEELLSSKTFSGQTPMELAYNFQHTVLRYHLAFYLKGGEFGRETHEFYEMYAKEMSKSASKIQEYAEKVASLDMSYFQDKETKAALEKFNLTENFSKLEKHLETAKVTGRFWNEQVVDLIKGSFFELKHFKKIFMQSFDDVMTAVKPKKNKEILEEYENKLKEMGLPNSLRRNLLQVKKDELNEETKDFSIALKEIKIFLKHISDHAKKNQEKASKVVQKLIDFKEMLVIDRENFYDDIQFLNCNVSVMNFHQLNETGFQLLKLEREIGIKDWELEKLVGEVNAHYQTLKMISDGRITMLSLSLINQAAQGILYSSRKGINQWISFVNVMKRNNVPYLNYLPKWLQKIGLSAKASTLEKIGKGMKTVGKISSGIGFGLGILDLIFTAITIDEMYNKTKEIENGHRNFRKKMTEIAKLNEKLISANRTMRNFEITMESRQKATNKLEELVMILDGAIKEAELLKNDWGNIANNLESLFVEANVSEKYLEEKAFISVGSKLKVMRDQWSDISNSAQSIALTITILRPDCFKCRRKRSLEQPHSIGELTFATEAGGQMIDITEQVYNETRSTLYDFKDNTFPTAARSVRHMQRFLMELQGNIDQLITVNTRFEEKINDHNEDLSLLQKVNTQEYLHKASTLHSKNQKFLNRRNLVVKQLLTEDIEGDLQNSLKIARSTYNNLKESTNKANKLIEKLSNTDVKLNDLKAFTQDEIVDLYIKATRKRDRVHQSFQSICDKSDEVIKLTTAIFSLSATSLSTAAIPTVGWAISLAIAPVQIGLEAASSKLQEEIVKETEEYIELQKQLLEKRVELGRIDLDIETLESLKELVSENKSMIKEMNSLGEDQYGWSSIAVNLSTMIDLGLITKQEVASNQFRYLPVDMQVMRDGTASIIKDISNMRIRFNF